MEYSHPIALLVACVQIGSTIQTSIKLEFTEGRPISPASLWIGDPPGEKGAYPIFRLHHLLSQNGNLYEFESFEEYEKQPQLPKVNTEYYFVNWWSQSQLSFAQSEPNRFKRYRFVSKEPEDHDHCYLCWKRISRYDENDKEAYTNGHDSLCCGCFDKYILSGFGKVLGDAK